MKRIHVAVGVVIDAENRVCITRRPEGKHLAGFWEFPGGKVEPGERVLDALKRELKEEIGIDVLESDRLTEIAFSYPDKSVLLDVLVVSAFDGNAEGLEGQELNWVKLTNLDDYRFPEANQAIIKALHHRFS